MKSARQYIDDLVELETIKVWSLIVTLFGDLGRNSPVPLSGKQIRHLLVHIGIKPPAIRVALHRLKKDGWIETTKNGDDGREVSYVLSDKGFAETLSASSDIYRNSAKYADGWTLQIQLEEPADHAQNQIAVFKNVVLVPKINCGPTSNVLDLSIPLGGVPDWLIERIVPQKVDTVAHEYTKILSEVDELLDQIGDLDRSAIRLLSLHHWRKMALRDNTWFHIWFFKDGSLAQCHRSITDLLNTIAIDNASVEPKIDA